MIHLRDTECSGLGVGGWEKNVYQENNIYELYIYISVLPMYNYFLVQTGALGVIIYNCSHTTTLVYRLLYIECRY